ncbi:hypothetical protein [uncultured Roseibium sp.]|uniref:hypothetical protein n=1 Tax=uncultured Roseibium sp. TaxID=1936171 RepID=UPI00260C2FFB|nr:hypothetical protein [uncultured Roseibium sp.]
MFDWFKSMFEKPKKWRLTPRADGTYMLEKWNPVFETYFAEEAGIRDQEHADEVIANLEREVTYRA